MFEDRVDASLPIQVKFGKEALDNVLGHVLVPQASEEFCSDFCGSFGSKCPLIALTQLCREDKLKSSVLKLSKPPSPAFVDLLSSFEQWIQLNYELHGLWDFDWRSLSPVDLGEDFCALRQHVLCQEEEKLEKTAPTEVEQLSHFSHPTAEANMGMDVFPTSVVNSPVDATPLKEPSSPENDCTIVAFSWHETFSCRMIGDFSSTMTAQGKLSQAPFLLSAQDPHENCRSLSYCGPKLFDCCVSGVVKTPSDAIVSSYRCWDPGGTRDLPHIFVRFQRENYSPHDKRSVDARSRHERRVPAAIQCRFHHCRVVSRG